MRIPLIKVLNTKENSTGSCHHVPDSKDTGVPVIAIVGSPNVGKSVLFNALTGVYVTVSNYPGTTVEVARGKSSLNGREMGVVDTPGMYQLLPITEDERVSRDILLKEQPEMVIHVVDAKTLERMLPMTLQLIEAGIPVMLDVNFMDEAGRMGIQLDVGGLEGLLGIPVVATALSQKRGFDFLRDRLAAYSNNCSGGQTHLSDAPIVMYHPDIEDAVRKISARLEGDYALSRRGIALLLLQGDSGVLDLVRREEPQAAEEISQIVESTKTLFSQPLSFTIMQYRRKTAQRILERVWSIPERRTLGFSDRLSGWMMNPLTGVPIFLLTLFLLYEFVGVLGAQTLVEWIEEGVFGGTINPWVEATLASYVPWQAVRDLIGGPYGIITLGVRYAVALILPIVGTFFIAFSIIEDTGYLPRLAMLIDRVFKRIGLNGRAVIPMVLGFGCDTMATIVTRTLETRRERLISTLLLALAIPCSAQLGVMLGLLAGRPDLLAVWVVVVAGIFLLVGFLAAALMPGERPTFYMELPPLRLPILSNVVVKTYSRMEWYFREVFPVFIFASVFIWLGQLTGLFDLLIAGLTPLVRWVGLPDDVSVAFLFGFFRRDYGAAGLYDMRGLLNDVQLLVATTTLTIFVPCVAQFAVTIKERGWKTALAISAFIFPFAFIVGGVLNRLLLLLGVSV